MVMVYYCVTSNINKNENVAFHNNTHDANYSYYPHTCTVYLKGQENIMHMEMLLTVTILVKRHQMSSQ